MRKIQTEILIIGGGATGAGIVRDLALRGFETVLVERRDLSDGTTGRYHGLLHSGARYAVKDPLAARECIEENRILRRILPQCIEDTGGFFVLTPGDDPAYAPRLLAGCRQAGIPIEEVPIYEMLRQEPLLNPAITRCLRVPDAAADSFLATRINIRDAQARGAQILRYHPVTHLSASGPGAERRITGAVCRDLLKDEEVHIHADLVINAAGAWAGKVAATAGIDVQMVPGKGVMLAANHRIVNTVINRCKMPGDGDILVPTHTVAVIGTTDTKAPDPDAFGIEDWEVQLMLNEGEKLIPGFRQMRFLRAWAGVRPLYQERAGPSGQGAHPAAAGSQAPVPVSQAVAQQNREITRAFVLLDHAARDGTPGLLTITGGKWTTYRKMAEVTADRACEILGTQRECRTHLETLAETGARETQPGRYYSLGHRLAGIETRQDFGQLVCECELVTPADIRRAILEEGARTLDDVRREVRLGKGPCQAGFCTLRAAGILHQSPPEHMQSKTATNTALYDFLQERWKGVRPVLWGQQLRQERLNELIYLNVLNIPALPGAHRSALAATPYLPPVEPPTSPTGRTAPPHPGAAPAPAASTPATRPVDVLVVGAGLAGLMTAWLCAENGLSVKLISKGAGTTHWASGCVDVLGCLPSENQPAVTAPRQALTELALSSPKHPYARTGVEALLTAMRKLQALCEEAGYPLLGEIDQNWLLPTAAGALRPTCLAPASFVAGDPRQPGKMLIVGFEQFLDFYPALIADNLNAQGVEAGACLLDLPALRGRRFTNAVILARLFDSPAFRREVAQAVRPHLAGTSRVGLPAVLGLHQAPTALEDLKAQLGLPVFEIPGLPPSIPGIRLATLLGSAIRKAGGQIFDGMQVNGAIGEERHLLALQSEAAARHMLHAAKHFVLATGGILGGGIGTHPDGTVRECVLGLPVPASENRLQWLDADFFSPQGHAIFGAGLAANETLQPLDGAGQPYYDNVFIAGGLLGNCDPLQERSLEGICLASAQTISRSLKK
ncbi:MAG: anaerobic glycerol-3-phosphate dehydrogenase subunit GlpA [Chloroflexota bacterium]